MAEKKWDIINVDVTIHAEQPRLRTIQGTNQTVIAGLLGIDFNAANVKAKTNEGLAKSAKARQ